MSKLAALMQPDEQEPKQTIEVEYVKIDNPTESQKIIDNMFRKLIKLQEDNKNEGKNTSHD